MGERMFRLSRVLSRSVVLNHGAAEPLGTVKSSSGMSISELNVYLLVNCS